MPIVGGLDIHRKQLTFDYVDNVTGSCKRGQIAPADRPHLADWLARRFTGRRDVEFALEGCTGWRYVAEELSRAGAGPHVGEPADTAALRGRKRHAKTDRTDARHLRLFAGRRAASRMLGPAGPHPGVPGAAGAVSAICGSSTPPGPSASMRCCSTRAPRGCPVRAGCAPSGAGPSWPRSRQSTCPRSGMARVATALAMLAILDEHLDAVHAQLLHAARHLTGAKILAARLYGVGPITALALTCWLAGAGRFSSTRKAVRFTGLDVTVHSSDGKTRTQALVPAGTGRAALVRVRGRQDPRPRERSGPRLLRAGQGAHRRQTGRHLRGPQDHPAGLSYPHRAR